MHALIGHGKANTKAIARASPGVDHRSIQMDVKLAVLLQSASLVVFAELAWSPGEIFQVIDQFLIPDELGLCQCCYLSPIASGSRPVLKIRTSVQGMNERCPGFHHDSSWNM